jgi:hypothetical protein
VRSFGYNTIRMGSYFKANTLSWTYRALNGEEAYGLGGVVVQMSISVSFGFRRTWTTNDAAPASFTLNGAVCR